MTIDYTFIKKWYGDLIPTNFHDLIEFSIISNQLTEDIHRLSIGIDAQASTSYSKNNICFMPSLYYLKDFYTEFLEIEDHQQQIKAAISLINGSQIHESINSKTLGEKFDYDLLSDKYASKGVSDNDNFKRCFSLIQALFADYYCFVNHPNVYPFVDLMNKVLYNDYVYEVLRENFDKDDIDSILKMLQIFKNDKYSLIYTTPIDKLPYGSQVRDILSRSKDTELTIENRFNLAFELFKLLDKNTSEDESHGGENLESKSIEDQKSLIFNLEDINYDKLKRIESEALEFVDRYEGDSKVDIDFQSVQKYRESGKVDYSPQFEGFSNYLKNARAEKQVIQYPRQIGNKIIPNRLMYSQVDGTIFGKKDNTRLEKGNPEIIFLLDFSGSMTRGDLIGQVISVAQTVFKDLKENNIKCAFYGHTSLKDKCLVVAIASNDMPLMKLNEKEITINYQQAFSKAGYVENGDNADGYAIEFVAQRFNSETRGKKMLMVLSDGQPSFSNDKISYGSISALEHVKNVVKIIRQSNISVVSLSLTEHVIPANDKIYGKEHNIAAYGNNLHNNLKNLIRDVVI